MIEEGSHLDRDVARLFDAMAGSYDELEPWYEHLYRALHAILLARLAPPSDGRCRRALDAGCGTGFQTALLARLGYRCHGVDLSSGLLAVARQRVPGATFTLGSIEALPYPAGHFDAVSCCGSTLSLVDSPPRALGEMSRVLRPGGSLLLECEQKWSLDLAWALVSGLAGDPLGFRVRPRELWRELGRPWQEAAVLDYPFPLGDGAVEIMRLRLFTIGGLDALLREAGLRRLRVWGIHGITNLIPSTVLHRARLGPVLAALFRVLCVADDVLRRVPAAARIANSVVVLAVKPTHARG